MSDTMRLLLLLIGVAIVGYTWQQSNEDAYGSEGASDQLSELLGADYEEAKRIRLEMDIEKAARETRKLYTDIKHAIYYLTGSVFIVAAFIMESNAGIRKAIIKKTNGRPKLTT